MSDIRDEMLRTLDRLVAANLTIGEREMADGKGPSAKLWAALLAQGMTALGETGSEIPFADGMALVARSGYHALPVPLAETIMARRLLSRAGIALPDGAITLAARTGSQTALAGVAYGGSTPHLVVAEGDNLHLVDATALQSNGAVTHKAFNQAGEPRDTIDISKARTIDRKPLANAADILVTEGALMRSLQLAGALSRTLEHCLTWVNDRVQFGKPIARFQAIQHAMAIMASEVAAARAACDMAVEASENDGADWFTVAVAKSRSGEAAGKTAAAAHAAFGAMGFTREHPLHYSTRRLWAWRDDFGSEVAWQSKIGQFMATQGGDKLWATLTEKG